MSDIIAGELLTLALDRLGGRAHLSRIYDEADRLWRLSGKNIPKNFDDDVRAAIYYHCPEAKGTIKGKPLFRRASERGRGWYALIKPLGNIPEL